MNIKINKLNETKEICSQDCGTGISDKKIQCSQNSGKHRTKRLRMSLFGQEWPPSLDTISARNLWTLQIQEHGLFNHQWQTILTDGGFRQQHAVLLTLCCQGYRSIALWTHCLAQFTPAHYNRKWAQSVCQNSPSFMLLSFKLFFVRDKSLRMLSFSVFMLQTTPIWLHLTPVLMPSVSDVSSNTWQEWGLTCARLSDTNREWQGLEMHTKIRSTVLQLAVTVLPSQSHSGGWLWVAL